MGGLGSFGNLCVKAVFLFVCSLGSCIFAQQENDIEAEIAHIIKEVSRIKSERAKVLEAAAKDAVEFSQYQERHKQKVRGLTSETDSVRRAVAVLGRRSDSLGVELTRLDASGREYALIQQNLRDKQITLCESAIAVAESLPPSLSIQAAAALAFLKSELMAKSVDNVESIHRLVTVLNDIETQLMDIQIMQGASPLAAIGGNCYRIRIGGVLEAVADIKGEKCAVWLGGGKDDWHVIDDSRTASKILEAVNVREGKTLPCLVELPFVEAVEPERAR